MSVSYNELLERMLSTVSEKYDKRESSIIYQTIAPCALEFANSYLEMAEMENEAYPDTATMPFLKRIADERGLQPYEETAAILKGKFNIEIAYGKRFTGLNTTLNYTVYDLLETTTEGDTTYYYYKCVCEQMGEIGNEYIGDIIPLDGDIEGLTIATLTEIITHGEDAENVEDFRTRYFDNINNQAYGGNIADYKKMLETIPGVGGKKIYPVWNGGGTVKAVIQGSSYDVPSSTLITTVKNTIDPTEFEGQGVGLAPIGHIVTIEGVTEENITVETTITYESEKTWNDISIAYYEAIDAYFTELNEDWEHQQAIIVRISQLESRLLDIAGILDVTDTKINGIAANYQAGENAIVKRAK